MSPSLFRRSVPGIEFALAVARASDGAFDPTIGRCDGAAGFDVNYRTGEHQSNLVPLTRASYRDVVLDPAAKTVMLTRPLLLDLGAVAKGLAVDLAAVELDGLGGFMINAGGDILVRGRGPEDGRWRIGIKDPSDASRAAYGGLARRGGCVHLGRL